MIPEIDLRYNYDYAKRLYKGQENFDEVWNKLIETGGRFEVLYGECIDDILEAIPKVTGYDWEEHADRFIPIYMVNNGNSFSHPLTLKIEDELGETLTSLIYQLVHCNMFFGFTSKELQKDIYVKSVYAITEEISIDIKDDINNFLMKNGIKMNNSSWDPKRENVKEYLNNNK